MTESTDQSLASRLFALALQGLAVLAGVLLAFSVESYGQNRDDRARAARLLAALETELDVNAGRLAARIEADEVELNLIDSLFGAVVLPPAGVTPSVDDLTEVISQIGPKVIQPYQVGALDDLMLSGGLTLVEDQWVRQGVLEYSRMLDSETAAQLPAPTVRGPGKKNVVRRVRAAQARSREVVSKLSSLVDNAQGRREARANKRSLLRRGRASRASRAPPTMFAAESRNRYTAVRQRGSHPRRIAALAPRTATRDRMVARRLIRSAPSPVVLPILCALAALDLAPPLSAQGRTAGGPPLDVAGLEVAAFEDYRTPAGRMEDGVWTVDLEAWAAAWYPWGRESRGLRAHILSETGKLPRVPGPLIRVSAGTPVRVTLRNTFPDTLLVRGLWDRSGEVGAGPGGALRGRPAVVAPGATANVRFTPTAPGTYFWMGRVLEGGWSAGPQPGLPRRGNDRSMVGVLIVDPPGAAPPADERVFLISHWADPELDGSFAPASRFMINGRSWPATERLSYAQGDTVRWRVLNLTGRIHPMHLHGFYFSVDARGDQGGEVVYGDDERQMAVTETLATGQSARITWVPTEPGNWIFHCHLMRHMSWPQTAGLVQPPGGDPPAGAMGEELMGGLVLGIDVAARPGFAPDDDAPRRRLDLHITRRPDVFGEAAGYGFVLETGAAPAADSVRFPGSPMVLTRGEPAEITVHNRADVALGVHWHGLELESWADGVPGWSGYPDAVRSAIAPGDSFVVRMTPPRAGTFMYHAHSEPGHQLAQGLYGPFIVLEPGEEWDPETDRLFLLGSLGSGQDPPPAVNGRRDPPPIELGAGRTYRLRFMHISPDDEKLVSLLDGDEPVAWRAVAKDGADLPPALVQDGPANLRIDVGETHDFLWTPAPGEYTLRVFTTFDRGTAVFPREAPPPATQDVRVRVRP